MHHAVVHHDFAAEGVADALMPEASTLGIKAVDKGSDPASADAVAPARGTGVEGTSRR